MSASNVFETDILELIFNNTTLALIGDATGLVGSSTAGNLYVGLHTADPGEAGAAQTTSEATYTDYARVAVARTSGGWTVSGNNASNAAVVTFPKCTGGTNTVTHFTIGTASSGTGYVLFSGALGSPLAVSNNITPSFPIGDIDTSAD